MTSNGAPEHSSLPLRDYDHLPAAAVAQRIRSLTADELGQLLEYEQAHANRLAVTQVLRARMAELEAGAAPSGGGQQAGPEWPEPPAGGSPVGPQTAAPPVSPPPHGNPAQPARPKGNKQA
jgi:hypothetical protein